MLFKTKLYDATWDTWMYYDNNKFYLYYLITEHSPGEGFGVAVSEDGINFVDYGKQLSASDKMRFYLGTGSVWKPCNSEYKYICNFSEWRETYDGLEQQIFFAHSKDLIHWEKLSENIGIKINPLYYENKKESGARWDCINVVETDDCFYGYWTALPKHTSGAGMGRSYDGINWEVLKPVEIDTECFNGKDIEIGDIRFLNGTYYLIVGSIGHPLGAVIMQSKSPFGPFAPQEKSFAVFSNQAKIHAYFPRFFNTEEELFVNFHVLENNRNRHNRAYTYIAPFKKVIISEDGTMRLKWWDKYNEIIGEKCTQINGKNAVLLNGTQCTIELATGETYTLSCDENCSVKMVDFSGKLCAEIDRNIPLKSNVEIKILIRNEMIEVYIDNNYIFSHTFNNNVQSIYVNGVAADYYILLV